MALFEYKQCGVQGNESECTRVYYECSGAGPAVMLLHGWGCTHELFVPLAKELSRSYTVYNFDLPGFGRSDEPATAWGMDEYVNMLEAFVAEHCPGPVSLVGHSFGGRMSILYASRNPVTRIVLVDAAGVRPKRTLGYYRRVYTYKFKRWLVLHVFHRPDLFELWRAHQGSADYKAASERMKPVFSKVVNRDLSGCLPAIQAPALLFWGEKDTATPLSDARLIERLIPAPTRLVVVPGAGHFAAFVEAPQQFAREVRAFFEMEADGQTGACREMGVDGQTGTHDGKQMPSYLEGGKR